MLHYFGRLFLSVVLKVVTFVCSIGISWGLCELICTSYPDVYFLLMQDEIQQNACSSSCVYEVKFVHFYCGRNKLQTIILLSIAVVIFSPQCCLFLLVFFIWGREVHAGIVKVLPPAVTCP